MKANEYNRLLDECIAKLKACHDKYYPERGALSDDTWEKLIGEMDAIAEGYRNTEVFDFASKQEMLFLDDIEFMHKRWQAFREKQNESMAKSKN